MNVHVDSLISGRSNVGESIHANVAFQFWCHSLIRSTELVPFGHAGVSQREVKAPAVVPKTGWSASEKSNWRIKPSTVGERKAVDGLR